MSGKNPTLSLTEDADVNYEWESQSCSIHAEWRWSEFTLPPGYLWAKITRPRSRTSVLLSYPWHSKHWGVSPGRTNPLPSLSVIGSLWKPYSWLYCSRTTCKTCILPKVMSSKVPHSNAVMWLGEEMADSRLGFVGVLGLRHQFHPGLGKKRIMWIQNIHPSCLWQIRAQALSLLMNVLSLKQWSHFACCHYVSH